MADYEWCLLIAFGMLAIVAACEYWQSKQPPSCRCDDANQGRNCKPPNCTPPRLPR